MLAQVLVSSVTAGAIYALIALGFVLIHKGTGVVHFGYGDQVTFGAYLVLIAQVIVGLPFGLSVLAAVLLSVLLGAVIYGGFMWPLRNASLLARIIASLALGTVLREFLRSYMGPSAWPFPFLLSPTAVLWRQGWPNAQLARSRTAAKERLRDGESGVVCHLFTDWRPTPGHSTYPGSRSQSPVKS